MPGVGTLLSSNKYSGKLVRAWGHYFPCDRILAQRIFKSTVNSTVAFIFCLIPKVRDHLGTEPAMLPLISVIVHPGRRVSGTIQGAIYCTTGLIFGLAYAIFGRFLAQECIGPSWSTVPETQQYLHNYKRFEAALAVLAVFETIMLFGHGWMRSVSHHYFGIVFPLFIVVHFTFLAPLTQSPAVIAKSFSTPFYLGIAMSLFWNIGLFPEFGSTYLGNATVDALNEIHSDIDESIKFFISLDCNDTGIDNTNGNENITSHIHLYNSKIVSLSKLLNFKTNIAKSINNCEVVLQECIYEISYSYVPPYSIQDVLKIYKNYSIFLNGLINACQLEFILLGKQQDNNSNNHKDKINKIQKEIEFGDPKRLLLILDHLRVPIFNLHEKLSKCIYNINLLIAYSYDVNLDRVYCTNVFRDNSNYTIPNDSNGRKKILDTINIELSVAQLQDAAKQFNESFQNELLSPNNNLLTPNDEIFLFSSFLMNLKQLTNETIKLTKNASSIYNFRKEKESKGWLRGRSLWFTFLKNFKSLRKWYLGNATNVTENETLKGVINENNKTEMVNRRPDFEENELLMQRTITHRTSISTKKNILPTSNFDDINEKIKVGLGTKILNLFIHVNKFIKRSKNHFRFGFQVAIALMASSFPMFIPKTRHWYVNYRGAWIGFVCILCLEPSIGGTFWVFFLRGVGVFIGALWGLISYYAGVHQTNPYLETVITLFGAVPGFYFLLGTPYVKAAIIEIISIYIVMVAAIIPSAVPGGIVANFAKRCLAVGYGGVVALVVQVIFFPIKARDQLYEEISFVCGCIAKMEHLYASGIEGEKLTTALDGERYEKIVKISGSAKAALSRAASYNGLTRQEPRIKGDFSELEKIFTQIIYVQQQIIERMDTAALLRKQYGSAIVEELNQFIFQYRRQLIGDFTSCSRAIQEAFLNKTPLPHFLPSTRISHRRLINKVRQVLKTTYNSEQSVRNKIQNSEDLGPLDVISSNEEESSSDNGGLSMTVPAKAHPLSADIDIGGSNFLLEEKYLSWNASSAALEEIIEYMEELLHLAKLVVGVNEFKYGFLSRPLYEDWAAEAVREFDDFVNGKKEIEEEDLEDSIQETMAVSNNTNEDVSIDSGQELESIRSSISHSSQEEAGQPIRFSPAYYDNESIIGRRESVNLARIASHKNSRRKSVIPKTFRKRIYSIGSRGGMELGESNNLDRTKTLGDVDYSMSESDTSDSSDEDLPLAFMRVVARMQKKNT